MQSQSLLAESTPCSILGPFKVAVLHNDIGCCKCNFLERIFRSNIKRVCWCDVCHLVSANSHQFSHHMLISKQAFDL